MNPAKHIFYALYAVI